MDDFQEVMDDALEELASDLGSTVLSASVNQFCYLVDTFSQIDPHATHGLLTAHANFLAGGITMDVLAEEVGKAFYDLSTAQDYQTGKRPVS